MLRVEGQAQLYRSHNDEHSHGEQDQNGKRVTSHHYLQVPNIDTCQVSVSN